MAQSSTSIGPSDGVCVCVPLANYTPQNLEITEFDPLDQKPKEKEEKRKKREPTRYPTVRQTIFPSSSSSSSSFGVPLSLSLYECIYL
jgi:hypothetical protein